MRNETRVRITDKTSNYFGRTGLALYKRGNEWVVVFTKGSSMLNREEVLFPESSLEEA